MKKPYFYVKIIFVLVFIMMLKPAYSQEVDTQQQTESPTLSEEGQNGVSGINTLASSSSSINETQWDILNPTSPASIFSTEENYNSVDMSTGKVNVRVPLATAGTSDIKIPIQLNYSTGGIKLRDVASWVGLGWNLSCGAKITRILNRFPDKLDGSIDSLLNSDTWTWSKPTTNTPPRKGNFDDRVKFKDTQPDLFYFEIPGKSGMFVLDAWGKAYTIPYQNVVINYDKTTQFFEILDDAGNRYLFQDTENTEIRTQNVKDRPKIDYKSTWYVSEIQNIKGDYVTFDYKGLTTGSVLQQYIYKTYSKSLFISTDYSENISYSQYDTYVDPLYLTKISWSNGRMEFISSDSREDLPKEAFRLDKINMYSDNEGGVLLKSYNFEYTTFENRAPKLDKITISTPQSSTPQFFRKFEYFTDKNLPHVTPYTNGGSYYYSLDHWGYFNNKNVLTGDLRGIPNFKIAETNLERGSYDDRTPVLEYTRANSLQKIWLSSSGYNEFEYELNTANVKKKTDTVGGLRIKSITTKSTELVNSATKVRYEYTEENGISSGVLFNEPHYYNLIGKHFPSFGVIDIYLVRDNPIRPLFDLDGSHITYGRVKEIFDNGSTNIYSYTTKIDYPDKGYTKTINLMNPEDIISYDSMVIVNKDIAPTNTRFWQRGLLTSKVSTDASGNETFGEYYFYEMNAPIKKTIPGLFPSTSPQLDYGKWIVIVPYLTYYDYISQPIYMTSKVTMGTDVPLTIKNYYYDDNDEKNDDLDHLLLKRENETIGNDLYETTYKYAFDYYAAPEGSTPSVINTMQDFNFSSVPIEIVRYKNGMIIGGQLNMYEDWNYIHNGSITGSMFNLKEVKELMLEKPKSPDGFIGSIYAWINDGYNYICDENYVTKSSFEYNRQNKLSCIKEYGKPSRSIIYDKRNYLPIAQIANAEAKVINGEYLEEAMYTSFEDYSGITHPRAKTGSKVNNDGYYINSWEFVPGLYTVKYWSSFNDGIDWELQEHEMEVIENQNRTFTVGGNCIIDELRIHKKDAQMVTRTYDVNYNVTSETDANEKSTYYDYDAFGRLIRVKDYNNDKLKEYQYFIKN